MSDVKPVIFISYSHNDEPDRPGPDEVPWLTYVQLRLAPAIRSGIFDLWVDEHIPGGGDWEVDIKEKLAVCDIFILLVSNNSLSSSYIVETEFKAIEERQKTEDVHVFPIVLEPFSKRSVPWLMKFNLRPTPNGEPLSDFAPRDRARKMVEIADEVAELAEKIAKKKAEAKAKEAMVRLSSPLSTGIRAFDIAHLPETAYEKLQGRDEELRRLDHAWTDSTTNILSLIAEGGAGKSALVNEWLKRMQVDNYRGADSVLGWSFYSQGTKERATSAEQFLSWAIDQLSIKIETTNATAKGEAIAEAMMKRRVLLVLDGCEPLQHGFDRQQGELKDQGLRALLRRFAAMPPAEVRGLIVLTSRLPVKDLAKWKDRTAPVLSVEQLSDEAGAALLRDNGVWGTDKELRAAAREFGGHPLALGLLASFLNQTQTSDVRRRDHVGALVLDDDNPRHGHAKRVMESYEKEWLDGQSVLLAILHIVGLFDRPASNNCLGALRSEPAIEGLTDAIINLDEAEWVRSIARLREVRLLAPVDPSTPDALDAHPLVREWFGARLKQTNETAWKAAHGRLSKYLRDNTKEGKAPTLKDLEPLYQAVAHGCRAGLHQQALHEIYIERICRRHADGTMEFYSSGKLGALGSDLAAMFWFFDKPYETPVETLRSIDKGWVLNEAAFDLRAQGRFAEALPTMRVALRVAETEKDWRNAAIAASNLSEAELLVGDVAMAVQTAELSVSIADRSADEVQAMQCRTTHADALHAAGSYSEAGSLFAEAERRQKKFQPAYPHLYSVQGYQYCDLLLAKGANATASNRATQTLKVLNEHYDLLSRALDLLTLGRAHHGSRLEHARQQKSAEKNSWSADSPGVWLDQAVDCLRASAQVDDLPRGLLARACFRRSLGDWDSAARDLDEVEEIAEPGPMKLFLCDMAIERARLAFATIEAFAPLNELLDDSSPKPVAPNDAEVARLKQEANKNLADVRKLITECGYHRRDKELAELEAVLCGERRFAELPPRV